MKTHSKTENKSSIFVMTIAWLSILAAVLIPDGMWRPPPASSQIGPGSYSSEVSKQAITVANISGDASQPSTATLRFQYRVSQRPSDYAYLIGTSSNPNGGIGVSIDKSGIVYLSLESKNKTASPYQLIKISDPHGLDTWIKISVFMDLGLEQVTITKDDKIVPIGEARDHHVIQMSNTMLTTSKVQIGGANGLNFDGEVRDFEMSFGSSGTRIDLINLKIFLGLISLFCVGLVTQFSKKRKPLVDLCVKTRIE